jgi:hypothetical protein
MPPQENNATPSTDSVNAVPASSAPPVAGASAAPASSADTATVPREVAEAPIPQVVEPVFVAPTSTEPVTQAPTPAVPPILATNTNPLLPPQHRSHTIAILLSLLLLILIGVGGYWYFRWNQPQPQPISQPVVSEPVPVIPEKPVEPVPPISSPVSLLESGLGVVAFGSSTQETVAKLSSLYGTSTKDTGLIDSFSVYGTCPGKKIRVVEWNMLRTFFGDTIYGKQKFFGYEYAHATTTTPVLTTGQGLTVGVSEDLLHRLYPGVKVTKDQNDINRFDIQVSASSTISGILENGKVTYLAGGIQCAD